MSSQEAAPTQQELDQEMENAIKQGVAKEVLRVHGILDNLLVQPLLEDGQILELVRRVMLPVRARNLDWEDYMKRMAK